MKKIAFLLSILFLNCILFSFEAKSEKKQKVTISGDTPWVLQNKQPESIDRALNDVKADWYKVFGYLPVIVDKLPENYNGPAIYLGEKGSMPEEFSGETFNGRESFVLKVGNDSNDRKVIMATGADKRGVIYAIYTFSEEILGVDPWYYWIDKEPLKRKTITIDDGFNKQSESPTFKYRGWFINDEDLLNTFADDPMKENVFSLEMYDRIYETILRLKGNMIVPATFPFPDERCQKLAASRGLILNMHHILVLGLNTYRWPDGVPFSHNKHPEIMEKYWQTCIDAFKDHEVVWTVGYRGKYDHPFWRDEPELNTPEARGKVITAAIKKQVEMINNVQPDADIIANMWMEGVELYQKGHIKIPDEVILVWPDNGAGIIRDNGSVKKGNGIYYHTAMLSHHHNQLSEMVNPARINREIGRFYNAGATSYFLVNVSDIRAVPLSTNYAMKLAWDSKPYLENTSTEEMDIYLKDWCKHQYGEQLAEKVAEVYKSYYSIPYMKARLYKGENYLHLLLRRLDHKVQSLLDNGSDISGNIDKEWDNLKAFSDHYIDYVEDLNKQATLIFKDIPADRKQFYQSHVLTQIQIHLQPLLAMREYSNGVNALISHKQEEAIAYFEQSLNAYEKMKEEMRKAEYGKWAGWYTGECFVGLDYNYDRIRTIIAKIQGISPPLIRKRRHYVEVCKYQERFAKNFPLLYPEE